MQGNRGVLGVGLGGHGAQHPVHEVNEGCRLHVLLRAVANEQTTADLIHAELLLQFTLTSFQDFPWLLDVQPHEALLLVEGVGPVRLPPREVLQLSVCDKEVSGTMLAEET
ncbi:hypothetical protein MLD38_022613 [Melastoma candidum]|uniref:Uncharacterized protein n=1 Tax=Melastoma candidum TaxID=119954 RepID=A0ACB9QMV7_9MYRT|nr:hypothetical protein MLD38_022613 [Melastoma candidum]